MSTLLDVPPPTAAVATAVAVVIESAGGWDRAAGMRLVAVVGDVDRIVEPER